MCFADNFTLLPPPDDPGKPSACEQRHGESFKGETLPFGCAVEFRSKKEPRVREAMKFEDNARPGISMGYEFPSGRK